MPSCILRWVVTPLIAISVCLANTYHQAAAADDFAAVCLAAKEAFRPLTDKDVTAALDELRTAAERLEERLAQDGDNGLAWQKYLRLDALQAELAKDQVDQAALDAVLKRFTAGHAGLRLLWFDDVQQALLRYRMVSYNAGNEKFAAMYGQLCDALPKLLVAYAAKPSAAQAQAIGGAMQQFEMTGQVPELIAAIQHRFVHPNLLLHVSDDVLTQGIGEPVDDVSPVRDVILKTNIYGTGHTVGETHVEMSPDDSRAVLETVLVANTRSNSVGYRGPVRVYTDGVTQLTARKRIWVTAEGLFSSPATSRATTSTTIRAICSRRGNKMIERFAWKQAGKQKAQAECIASCHAEQQLNRRINDQAGEMLRQSNEAFTTKFRKPLLERKLFPQQLDFSSTDDGIHVVALRADASQLAAPGDPPPLVEGPDLAVRMHESMFNNATANAFSGMHVTDEMFKKAIVSLLGELPERMKADEDEEEWAIDFPTSRPLEVSFDDGGFSFTLRGRRFYRGDERHPGMDVTAEYKIEPTDTGYKAVRQGELKIFPPGFKPGSGQKMSTGQIIIRRLLQRRFGKLFQEELVGKGLELPGKWGEAGKMRPVQMECEDGWVTIAWRREAPSQPKPQESAGR